jgi:DNA/RNA endonuclease YhcR with UshA esterase domain
MTNLKLFIFSAIFIISAAFTSYSQLTVRPEDAINHIGENVTVCGLVADTHYAYRSKGHPTFLNLNRPYPNQVLTVVIWGSDRVNFIIRPELLYNNRTICVTGTVKKYRGTPEILVHSPSQIKQ